MKKKLTCGVSVSNIFTEILCISISLMINPAGTFAQDVEPGDLEFRRQAVRRMIFDKSQNIPLAGLWPSEVIGLDVIHPSVGQQKNNPQLAKYYSITRRISSTLHCFND